MGKGQEDKEDTMEWCTDGKAPPAPENVVNILFALGQIYSNDGAESLIVLVQGLLTSKRDIPVDIFTAPMSLAALMEECEAQTSDKVYQDFRHFITLIRLACNIQRYGGINHP